jgi:2-oxoglutarate ferredoxin oxidoreductase subunit gamma
MSKSPSGFTQPALGDGPPRARAGLLAERGFLEVRFGGTGLQGVILMGVVLAMAATRDHRYVAQTQTYGLEEREGYGHSDVIISDHPVDYPQLQAADLLVALSPDAADGYTGLLREDGVLIFDSANVTAPPVFAGVTLGIPFSRLAVEATGRSERTVDVLTLGAVVGITGVVSVESLREALAHTEASDPDGVYDKALVAGLSLDVAEWRRSGSCS